MISRRWEKNYGDGRFGFIDILEIGDNETMKSNVLLELKYISLTGLYKGKYGSNTNPGFKEFDKLDNELKQKQNY
ncbi:hypothetical protein RCL_jg17509.t1 [Rhizophagus clarus]|uniref:Uncharacterized protein n=1 Tax=Rhizophagus clarus TaxID=94130 RepID=A0A8H3KUL8_9GLOM|nr:hypothetical protein RCL_jg17509.t1 [Rhizophagus clarus]